jgi:hypothetical protein
MNRLAVGAADGRETLLAWMPAVSEPARQILKGFIQPRFLPVLQ